MVVSMGVVVGVAMGVFMLIGVLTYMKRYIFYWSLLFACLIALYSGGLKPSFLHQFEFYFLNKI